MDKKDLVEAETGDLIPYYMIASNTPLKYNDIQFIPNVDQNASPAKPFDPKQVVSRVVTAKDFEITGLPQEVVGQNALDMVEQQIAVYKTAFSTQTPAQFWELLMKVSTAKAILTTRV